MDTGTLAVSTRKVGIMADSHGDAGRIRSAIDYFRLTGCSPIFHLGDICDSAHPETAQACLEPLMEAGVMAVKGNNDHALIVNNADIESSAIDRRSLEYLQRLPLRLAWHEAAFVHSRPFVDRLGLSCMIGALSLRDARRYFQDPDRPLLFRGHSHSPQIIVPGGEEDAGGSRGEPRIQWLQAGDNAVLPAATPCIITCGALIDDSALIWEPRRRRLHCVGLRCRR